MSNIKAQFQDNILKIEKLTSRQNSNNKKEILLDELEYGNFYISNIKATNPQEKNKIFLKKQLQNDDIIAVYSENGIIKYGYCSLEKFYKKVVSLKFKVLNLKLNKKVFKIKLISYLINKYKLDIQDIKFFVDDKTYKKTKLKQYNKQISFLKRLKKINIKKFKFNISDILKDDSEINGSIKYVIKIDGNDIEYKIGKKEKNLKNIRHYYAPIKSIFVKDFAINIRRTKNSNLVFVKRKIEYPENTFKFRLLENKGISYIFYNISKINIKFIKTKINLYYEKFASKAEEGAYDLFLLAQNKSKNSKNYFVIDKNSPDYEKIKQHKNVIKKYSLKYYWYLYNANNFISTEAPIHLNILRSNNRYLRMSLTDKKFVFLQHGIAYMKWLGKNSTYIKGKEGEVSYIVACSEKEKDVLVDMLEIDENQVLKTGVPIYGKIKYNHINNNSEDIATIMLTWKPYEEQLYDFEKSEYYKNVVEICKILKKYVDNIIIIAHPKAKQLLKTTDLKNNLWDEPISKALEKTKLLITDYSSVCYNAFYQGAGVIFYQPDLDLYEKENGKLIPNNDEYIGKRTYNIQELENMFKNVIINKKIDLNKIRTKKFEENYKQINEFSDGKNIERIYDNLEKLKLV